MSHILKVDFAANKQQCHIATQVDSHLLHREVIPVRNCHRESARKTNNLAQELYRKLGYSIQDIKLDYRTQKYLFSDFSLTTYGFTATISFDQENCEEIAVKYLQAFSAIFPKASQMLNRELSKI